MGKSASTPALSMQEEGLGTLNPITHELTQAHMRAHTHTREDDKDCTFVPLQRPLFGCHSTHLFM